MDEGLFWGCWEMGWIFVDFGFGRWDGDCVVTACV